MAEKLSDLQKAALDFMIEYKKVDDSFIGVFADVANDLAKGAQAITDAATWIGEQGKNYVTNDPVHATANLFNTATRVATEIGDAGVAATAGSAELKGSPANVSLEDLIKARHGLR